MARKTKIDEAAAHRYFAAHCFNQAWDLIEKEDRSPEDDRLMVATSHASIYHWLERADCDSEKLSVGYWQLSRVLSLTGSADEALKAALIVRTWTHSTLDMHMRRWHAPPRSQATCQALLSILDTLRKLQTGLPTT